MLAVACTPDEDKNPVDASKGKMLMHGSWQLSDYRYTPDIAAEVPVTMDYYTPLPGCQKDDYMIFNSGSLVSKYQGLTKCSINDPDSIVYNYSLEQDEKFLRIWGNPDDPENSVLMAGDITYPDVRTFIITYLATNPTDEELTSRHTLTFTKQ